MHKLGEGEATMTKEEYTKMKQELEAWVWQAKHHILFPLGRSHVRSFTKVSKTKTNIFLLYLFYFQWVPGCVQENCPSARSLPAESVLSPQFEQRQKLPDFLRVWPGCEFPVMLTSSPELSVGKEEVEFTGYLWHMAYILLWSAVMLIYGVFVSQWLSCV